MKITKEEKALIIIRKIGNFISRNGVCINKAQSAYGATTYKLGKLWCSFEDEYYTCRIISENLGLSIADCCGTLEIEKGSLEDLDTLYSNVFGDDPESYNINGEKKWN